MGSQRGQATIEFVGLVLLVALALGAALRFVPRASGGDRALGAAVAERIRCAAAGDVCAGAPGNRSPASALGAPGPTAPGATFPPASGPGAPHSPPDVSEPKSGAVRAPPIPGDIARRFPRLARVADLLSRKAWIACFGYESHRFNMDHRFRVNPNLTMSPRDALAIANTCLNPYSFFPG